MILKFIFCLFLAAFLVVVFVAIWAGYEITHSTRAQEVWLRQSHGDAGAVTILNVDGAIIHHDPLSDDFQQRFLRSVREGEFYIHTTFSDGRVVEKPFGYVSTQITDRYYIDVGRDDVTVKAEALDPFTRLRYMLSCIPDHIKIRFSK